LPFGLGEGVGVAFGLWFCVFELVLPEPPLEHALSIQTSTNKMMVSFRQDPEPAVSRIEVDDIMTLFF
jgi:hypothetical protein